MTLCAARLPLVITGGDPDGIGPDLCLRFIQKRAADVEAPEIVIVANRPRFESRAKMLGMDPEILARAPGITFHWSAEEDVADDVFTQLAFAADGCLCGKFGAMVTAPVQKHVQKNKDPSFIGVTEFLEQRTRQRMPESPARAMMMLANDTMRVVLMSTHIPLSQVPQAISQPALVDTIARLHQELRCRFNIADPTIAVLGLNPHAGESGTCGIEEQTDIIPAIAECRQKGMVIEGPLPADTAFLPAVCERVDCLLAMYHDQGLPVVKYADFDRTVNVTLGLPFIRTSPGHGVALEHVGTDAVNPNSFYAAIRLAQRLSGSIVES